MAVPTPNSMTGGYLPELPAPYPRPVEGDALRDLLQAVLVGVTGINGTLVRPRWQPTPPQQPAVTTNWCAFGIIDRDPDANPAILHQPDVTYPPEDPPDPDQATGADLLVRQEELKWLCSFYGPDCQDYASQFRDGIYIPQNREALNASLISLVTVGNVKTVPEFINGQWVNRADVMCTLRRQVKRTYPVVNITSAGGGIETAVYDVDFEA